MAFTQTDLDSINELIASAEISWRYGDRSVTYGNIEDLKARRQLIIDDINATNPPAKPRRRIFRATQTGKGYA
jgi:hypothetical protein